MEALVEIPVDSDEQIVGLGERMEHLPKMLQEKQSQYYLRDSTC